MWIITVAAFGGLLAMLMGASADHLFRVSLSPEAFSNIQTAIDYQFVHVLLLVVIGVLMRFQILRQRCLLISAWAFTVGLIAFCGGLYTHAIFNVPFIVYFVPFGGLALMTGWLFLLFASIPKRAHD